MAKKTEEQIAADTTNIDTTGFTDGLTIAGAVDDTVHDGENAISDFNLGTDYKMDPIAPAGMYFGAITEAKLDTKNAMLVISITLNDNGGVLSDGESPLDGYVVRHRLFLPKPEDRNIPTKSGRGSKWQWKVNNLAKFFNAVEVNLPTLNDIKEACENGDFIGIPLQVELTADEYNGEYQNNVKKITKS